MELESRRAGANAGSPGPFEIGSAERRNCTDNPLAAISWRRLKEGTLGERRQKAYRTSETGQGDQDQRSGRTIIGKKEKYRELKGQSTRERRRTVKGRERPVKRSFKAISAQWSTKQGVAVIVS